MANRNPSARRAPTLRLKVGNWLQADATGWAVVLVPLLLVILLAAALLS